MPSPDPCCTFPRLPLPLVDTAPAAHVTSCPPIPKGLVLVAYSITSDSEDEPASPVSTGLSSCVNETIKDADSPSKLPDILNELGDVSHVSETDDEGDFSLDEVDEPLGDDEIFRSDPFLHYSYLPKVSSTPPIPIQHAAGSVDFQDTTLARPTREPPATYHQMQPPVRASSPNQQASEADVWYADQAANLVPDSIPPAIQPSQGLSFQPPSPIIDVPLAQGA